MSDLRAVLAGFVVVAVLLAACDGAAGSGADGDNAAGNGADDPNSAQMTPADVTERSSSPGQPALDGPAVADSAGAPDLDGLRLASDGLELVRFGDPADQVIALLEERLGEADERLDWRELVELPEPLEGSGHRYADVAEAERASVSAELPLHRDICWQMLCIHIAGTTREEAVFTSWELALWRDERYAPGTDILPPPPTPGLRTEQGLSTGTSFSELQAALGDALELEVYEGGSVAFTGIPGWDPVGVGAVPGNGTIAMDVDAAFEPTEDEDAFITSLAAGTHLSYLCC